MLKRGDLIVCITKYFEHFTYGKTYKVEEDQESDSLVDIQNDRGDRYLPAMYGSKRIYYFVKYEDYINDKIDDILL